jgi:hypothetical protein
MGEEGREPGSSEQEEGGKVITEREGAGMVGFLNRGRNDVSRMIDRGVLTAGVWTKVGQDTQQMEPGNSPTTWKPGDDEIWESDGWAVLR